MNNPFTGKCTIEIHPDNLDKTGAERLENCLISDMIPDPPGNVDISNKVNLPMFMAWIFQPPIPLDDVSDFHRSIDGHTEINMGTYKI